MGKRSRKPRAVGARVGPAAVRATPRRDERPKAPWHPVPLVELCVLIGIVLIVLGLFTLGDRRGTILVVCGLALGSLAGLDTTVREHYAGFRSHTALLAGVPAVLAAGVGSVAQVPWPVLVGAAVALYALAFARLRRGFRRASGGRALS